MRSRLANLPKDTIVLYISIQLDGAGRPYISRDLVPSFSAASSVPTYGLSGGFIGLGIVGGSVVNFEAQGTQVGEIGQRILRGERPADIPPITSISSYIFDWRQLRHFGLSESALPRGSIVSSQSSPRGTLQTMDPRWCGFHTDSNYFIGYLLLQMRRRRRAESSLSYELRFESLLSSLSATFANVPADRTNARDREGVGKA